MGSCTTNRSNNLNQDAAEKGAGSWDDFRARATRGLGGPRWRRAIRIIPATPNKMIVLCSLADRFHFIPTPFQNSSLSCCSNSVRSVRAV